MQLIDESTFKCEIISFKAVRILFDLISMFFESPIIDLSFADVNVDTSIIISDFSKQSNSISFLFDSFSNVSSANTGLLLRCFDQTPSYHVALNLFFSSLKSIYPNYSGILDISAFLLFDNMNSFDTFDLLSFSKDTFSSNNKVIVSVSCHEDLCELQRMTFARLSWFECSHLSMSPLHIENSKTHSATTSIVSKYHSKVSSTPNIPTPGFTGNDSSTPARQVAFRPSSNITVGNIVSTAHPNSNLPFTKEVKFKKSVIGVEPKLIVQVRHRIPGSNGLMSYSRDFFYNWKGMTDGNYTDILNEDEDCEGSCRSEFNFRYTTGADAMSNADEQLMNDGTVNFMAETNTNEKSISLVTREINKEDNLCSSSISTQDEIKVADILEIKSKFTSELSSSMVCILFSLDGFLSKPQNTTEAEQFLRVVGLNFCWERFKFIDSIVMSHLNVDKIKRMAKSRQMKLLSELNRTANSNAINQTHKDIPIIAPIKENSVVQNLPADNMDGNTKKNESIRISYLNSLNNNSVHASNLSNQQHAIHLSTNNNSRSPSRRELKISFREESRILNESNDDVSQIDSVKPLKLFDYKDDSVNLINKEINGHSTRGASPSVLLEAMNRFDDDELYFGQDLLTFPAPLCVDSMNLDSFQSPGNFNGTARNSQNLMSSSFIMGMSGALNRSMLSISALLMKQRRDPLIINLDLLRSLEESEDLILKYCLSDSTEQNKSGIQVDDSLNNLKSMSTISVTCDSILRLSSAFEQWLRFIGIEFSALPLDLLPKLNISECTREMKLPKKDHTNSILLEIIKSTPNDKKFSISGIDSQTLNYLPPSTTPDVSHLYLRIPFGTLCLLTNLNDPIYEELTYVSDQNNTPSIPEIKKSNPPSIITGDGGAFSNLASPVGPIFPHLSFAQQSLQKSFIAKQQAYGEFSFLNEAAVAAMMRRGLSTPTASRRVISSRTINTDASPRSVSRTKKFSTRTNDIDHQFDAKGEVIENEEMRDDIILDRRYPPDFLMNEVNSSENSIMFPQDVVSAWSKVPKRVFRVLQKGDVPVLVAYDSDMTCLRLVNFVPQGVLSNYGEEFLLTHGEWAMQHGQCLSNGSTIQLSNDKVLKVFLPKQTKNNSQCSQLEFPIAEKLKSSTSNLQLKFNEIREDTARQENCSTDEDYILRKHLISSKNEDEDRHQIYSPVPFLSLRLDDKNKEENEMNSSSFGVIEDDYSKNGVEMKVRKRHNVSHLKLDDESLLIQDDSLMNNYEDESDNKKNITALMNKPVGSSSIQLSSSSSVWHGDTQPEFPITDSEWTNEKELIWRQKGVSMLLRVKKAFEALSASKASLDSLYVQAVESMFDSTKKFSTCLNEELDINLYDDPNNTTIILNKNDLRQTLTTANKSQTKDEEINISISPPASPHPSPKKSKKIHNSKGNSNSSTAALKDGSKHVSSPNKKKKQKANSPSRKTEVKQKKKSLTGTTASQLDSKSSPSQKLSPNFKKSSLSISSTVWNQNDPYETRSSNNIISLGSPSGTLNNQKSNSASISKVLLGYSNFQENSKKSNDNNDFETLNNIQPLQTRPKIHHTNLTSNALSNSSGGLSPSTFASSALTGLILGQKTGSEALTSLQPSYVAQRSIVLSPNGGSYPVSNSGAAELNARKNIEKVVFAPIGTPFAFSPSSSKISISPLTSLQNQTKRDDTHEDQLKETANSIKKSLNLLEHKKSQLMLHLMSTSANTGDNSPNGGGLRIAVNLLKTLLKPTDNIGPVLSESDKIELQELQNLLFDFNQPTIAPVEQNSLKQLKSETVINEGVHSASVVSRKSSPRDQIHVLHPFRARYSVSSAQNHKSSIGNHSMITVTDEVTDVFNNSKKEAGDMPVLLHLVNNKRLLQHTQPSIQMSISPRSAFDEFYHDNPAISSNTRLQYIDVAPNDDVDENVPSLIKKNLLFNGTASSSLSSLINDRNKQKQPGDHLSPKAEFYDSPEEARRPVSSNKILHVDSNPDSYDVRRSSASYVDHAFLNVGVRGITAQPESNSVSLLQPPMTKSKSSYRAGPNSLGKVIAKEKKISSTKQISKSQTLKSKPTISKSSISSPKTISALEQKSQMIPLVAVSSNHSRMAIGPLNHLSSDSLPGGAAAEGINNRDKVIKESGTDKTSLNRKITPFVTDPKLITLSDNLKLWPSQSTTFRQSNNHSTPNLHPMTGFNSHRAPVIEEGYINNFSPRISFDRRVSATRLPAPPANAPLMQANNVKTTKMLTSQLERDQRSDSIDNPIPTHSMLPLSPPQKVQQPYISPRRFMSPSTTVHVHVSSTGDVVQVFEGSSMTQPLNVKQEDNENKSCCNWNGGDNQSSSTLSSAHGSSGFDSIADEGIANDWKDANLTVVHAGHHKQNLPDLKHSQNKQTCF